MCGGGVGGVSRIPVVTPFHVEIYIGKAGQVLGPYYPDEIQKRLDADLFDGTELAWHEGLVEWVNVKELLEDDAPSQEAEETSGPWITGHLTLKA